MEWWERLTPELPPSASPDLVALAIAVVTTATAYGLGFLVSAWSRPRVESLVARWAGRKAALSAGRSSSMLRYGIAALILFVAGRALLLPPLAFSIVAVAFTIAIGIFVFRVVRIAGLGRGASGVVAALALSITAASLLGRLEPLIAAMEAFGLTVGPRRISLLAVFNFVLVAAALFVGARIGLKILDHLIGRTRGLDATQRVLAQKLAAIALISALALLGVDLLGVDLTTFAVFSGALGLAIGFGLQKTFGNLLAGVILLMDRSVKPGDVIVVGDSFGTVNKIGVRAVSIITRDGKEHLIPNEQMMIEPVENWSFSTRSVRLHIPVRVPYDCDLALAQRLMVDAAMGSARVSREPRPSTWLKNFGESGIEHDILAWIPDPELGVGAVQSDILNRLWVLFNEHEIQVPFARTEVYIRAFPPPATE